MVTRCPICLGVSGLLVRRDDQRLCDEHRPPPQLSVCERILAAELGRPLESPLAEVPRVT